MSVQIPKTVGDLIRPDAPASEARDDLGLGDLATLDAADLGLTPTIPGLVIGAATTEEAAANWAILQAIHDDSGEDGGWHIPLPEGSVGITRSLNLYYPDGTLEGQGTLASTLRMVGSQAPTVVLGVHPSFSEDGTLDASDFVDSGPLLSGTAGGWAPRLRAGADPLHLTFSASSWSHPAMQGQRGTGSGLDCWDQMPAICLELALDTGVSGFAGGGPICGVGAGVQPQPLALCYAEGGGALTFQLRTDDGTVHLSTCPLVGKTGILRLDVQVHMDTGHVDWIVDGTWRSNQSQFADWAGSSKVLMPNTDCPWKFCGMAGMEPIQADGPYLHPGFAFTLLGARLSDAIRYTSGSLPGNDDRYRTVDSDTTALLPFDDDLDEMISDRQFRTYHGPASGANSPGTGFLAGIAGGGAIPFVATPTVCDLTIEGGGYYGNILTQGCTLNARLSNIRLRSGGIGWGGKWGSNYTTYLEGVNYVENTWIIGIDRYYHILKHTGIINFGTVGICAVYSDDGEMNLDQVVISTTPNEATRWGIYSRGLLLVRLLLVDNEGDDPDSGRFDAWIGADLTATNPLNQATVEEVRVGFIPNGGALFRLGAAEGLSGESTVPGSAGMTTFLESGPTATGAMRGVWDVEDDRWQGDFSATEAPWIAPATVTPGGTAGQPQVNDGNGGLAGTDRVVFDAFNGNSMDIAFEGGGLFRSTEASAIGTLDIFFQAVPVNSAGWLYMNAYNAAGLALGTAGTGGPVTIRPADTVSATFPVGGGVTLASGDIEVSDLTKGVILKSPNGTRWRVTVSNAGALVVTSI